tara:strand:- start:288 stop:482 length:195 start_codon:yes stop_codon:yes gene_type:complete
MNDIELLKKQLEEEVKEKNLYMTKFAQIILEQNRLRDKLANALRYVNACNIKLKETKERFKKHD